MKEERILITIQINLFMDVLSAFEKRGPKLRAVDVFTFIQSSVHFVFHFCPLE